MSTKRVLILGGGFGGVAAAHRLRALLDDGDEIILADRGTHFLMGFRKTGAIIGRDTLEDGRRPLAALANIGIDVRHTDVTEIEPGARAAVVGGERIEADAVLVALGAQTAPQAIPGLAEHGINVYAADGVPAAAAALAGIDKERLVIGIFGAPYKCPPAPFELALLAHEALHARGARPTITVFSPLPSSLPVVGAAGCEALEGRMAGLMIDFMRETVAERVEADHVVTSAGDVGYDVLLAIPPHRVPEVIAESGLAPGGWIKVDPATLATGTEGVWAVGDCTAVFMGDGKPMPKAGELAQGAGTIAAEHIAAFLAGHASDARYLGEGTCFLETGAGEAMKVHGRFLTGGPPDVELAPPSAEVLHAKIAFERDRLDAWFGPAT